MISIDRITPKRDIRTYDKLYDMMTNAMKEVGNLSETLYEYQLRERIKYAKQVILEAKANTATGHKLRAEYNKNSSSKIAY